jgi:Helix-turn-helix domain of resolvase
MDAVQEAQQLLSKRLDELNAEREKLSAALKELGGDGSPAAAPKRRGRPPGKPSAAPRVGRKRRRSRKGGSRLDQAVALVEERPGISASDIAKELKIKPNYLYRVMNEAVADKRVTKSGRSYLPAASA